MAERCLEARGRGLETDQGNPRLVQIQQFEPRPGRHVGDHYYRHFTDGRRRECGSGNCRQRCGGIRDRNGSSAYGNRVGSGRWCRRRFNRRCRVGERDGLAIAKDVTSSDSLKNYVAAGVSGGIAGQGIGVRLAVNSALKTVVNGGKFKDNLAQAAIGLAADALSGAIYEKVGDSLVGSGLPTKVAVHAIVGGLIGEAAGGDFATAALAAGANKALIQMVGDKIFPGAAHEQVLAMTSQLLGMTVAAAAGGSEKDQQVAGWVAQQGTVYNYLKHEEADALSKELVGCRTNSDPAACRGGVEKNIRT